MTLYPWQQPQWQQLAFSLSNRKFPHALLLTGPKAMGKLQFAQVLAKQLLCQTAQDQDAAMACDLCRSCQWLEAGNHPDLFLVQPETEGGLIKIDQIRTLVEELSQTGQQGGYQLVIIEPAEAMNKAAANALLKTLEEPSGQVVFLMVSNNLGLLPATIISRCQRVHFPPPAAQLSLAWLEQQLPSKTQAELSVGLSMNEYVPLRTLAFYQADQQIIYQKIAQGFLQLYLGSCSPGEMATLCMNYDFILVFNVLWLVIIDLLQLKLQAQQPQIMHGAQLDLLLEVNSRTTCFKLLQFIDQLLVAKQQVIANKINLNAQLLFEDLFIYCVARF